MFTFFHCCQEKLNLASMIMLIKCKLEHRQPSVSASSLIHEKWPSPRKGGVSCCLHCLALLSPNDGHSSCERFLLNLQVESIFIFIARGNDLSPMQGATNAYLLYLLLPNSRWGGLKSNNGCSKGAWLAVLETNGLLSPLYPQGDDDGNKTLLIEG